MRAPASSAQAAEEAPGQGHFGLANMQQRAEQIGALLDVRRWPAGGTRVASSGVRSDPMIRVAVVDDHPLVREGTAALVDRQEDMEIAGVAASLDELRPILQDGDVQVLLLDLRLGEESGFDLLRDENPGRCRRWSS